MHCQNFQPDDVTYMSDELGLHRVENTSHSNPAVSLHLYSPPFQSCQVDIKSNFQNILYELRLKKNFDFIAQYFTI